MAAPKIEAKKRVSTTTDGRVNKVTFFRTELLRNWGYRLQMGPNILWETFGFKTKRAAMRDYHKQKNNGLFVHTL